MYERILIATDLTDASMPALRTAFQLARHLGSVLHVLFVSEPPFSARHWYSPVTDGDRAFYRDIEAREREAAAKVLAEQLKGAEPSPHDGISVVTHVRPGIPSDVIVGSAKELRCDLIVMGTHARKGLSHAMIGSIAERVVRTAPCAVLTVNAAMP